MKVLVCVYDSKAEVFFDPWTARTRGEAARQFATMVEDPQNGMLHKHPADYTLMALGEWDEFTGGIHVLMTPEAIMNGLVMRPEQEEPANVQAMNNRKVKEVSR